MSDPLVNAMIVAGGQDVITGEYKDPKQAREARERHVVRRYLEAEKDFQAAKEAVARHVLECSGIAAGQLCRTVNHCVYVVQNGSGWVNQGKPHMVLTTRRVYRGGKKATSSSTHWASSLTPLTSDQAHRWINGEDVKW